MVLILPVGVAVMLTLAAVAGAVWFNPLILSRAHRLRAYTSATIADAISSCFAEQLDQSR